MLKFFRPDYFSHICCQKKSILTKDLKEIYSKNNIKIYMKKVKNDTFEKCIY